MNNKYWSWTEKQKRKQSKGWYWHHVPKDFRKYFWKTNRNKNKLAIIAELKDESGIFSLRTERHQAQWCYD